MVNIYIDCGCFDGDTIIEFLKKHNNGTKWQVYGFDPNPHFDYVWRMIPGKYDNIDKFSCKPFAVWDCKEVKPFTVRPPERPLGSSLMPSKAGWGEGEMIDAPCFDFSEWLEQIATPEDYVYLKMDIEGAEYRVLDKMIRDNTISLVNVLKIEWHDTKLTDANYAAIHAKLAAALRAKKIKVINQMS